MRPGFRPGNAPARQYDRRVISVCMATFNGARFVERQVATILEQLEPGDELVVSDDGSTDGTVALVRAFVDSRIRILEGKPFHSPLRNFERAVSHAAGDTIVLADQDDAWLPNKLPLVRDLFAGETARPYLVVLDARIVDEEERVVYPSVQARLDAGPGLVKNIWANRYLGCCMAFSRDLLDVALPFPDGVDMHDIWLGQLCERIGTTAFIPVTTMLYRRHDDTATGFELRFQPVQQVRRRAVLVWELARRGRRRSTARA
jgi:glycosyltransferase involved in cell wall biosynthesis